MSLTCVLDGSCGSCTGACLIVFATASRVGASPGLTFVTGLHRCLVRRPQSSSEQRAKVNCSLVGSPRWPDDRLFGPQAVGSQSALSWGSAPAPTVTFALGSLY